MDDLPPEEVERQRALYGPFTQAVRDLVDATIRTTVDDDEVAAVHAEIEELTHCDRAYVFRNGAITATLAAGDLTEEKVLEASFAEHAA